MACGNFCICDFRRLFEFLWVNLKSKFYDSYVFNNILDL